MYNKPCGHTYACQCPPTFSPTQYCPPQISPTQHSMNTNVSKTVVPNIHPTHNKTINKHLIQNQHYFPHTNSVINECYVENVICGAPINQCCPPRPFGF